MKDFTPKSFREAIKDQALGTSLVRSSAADTPFQSSDTDRPQCPRCGAYDGWHSEWCYKPPPTQQLGSSKPVPEGSHDSSTLDYWQSKQGKCLACNCEISVEDQYCPTHAQELGEMIDDSLVRSSDSHRAFQH